MEVSLDNICRSYLGKNGYNTLHLYVRCMRHLIDFLRKVSVNHAIFDKTVVLRLDEKKAVQFPTDCIRPTKVGWQKGDRIIGFQIDSSINLHHDQCDDGPAETPNDPFDPNSAWPYNGNGSLSFNNLVVNGVCGALAAIPVGSNGLGYFKVSHSKREIQFSSDVPQDFEIYLEYRTNGFLPKTKSLVPELFAKLGEDYIHWQLARYKFGDAAAETEGRRIAYQKEYEEVIAQLSPISKADIIGAKARGFHVNKIIA